MAAVALLFSAVRMTWAWYQVRGSAGRTDLHAGRPGIVLVAAGSAVLVLAAAQLAFRARWLPMLSGLAGATGLVFAVASALGGIAQANSFTVNVGGTTSYASGGPVGAAASIVIVACAGAQLAHLVAQMR